MCSTLPPMPRCPVQMPRSSPRRDALRWGSSALLQAAAARSLASRPERTDRRAAPGAPLAPSTVRHAEPAQTAAATFVRTAIAPRQALRPPRDPWARPCGHPDRPCLHANPRARAAAPVRIVAGAHAPQSVAAFSRRAASAARSANSAPIAAPPSVNSMWRRWATARSLRAARPTTACRALVRSTRRATAPRTAARGSAA
jgi:hypothetical protein